jgi:hypothetical protein
VLQEFEEIFRMAGLMEVGKEVLGTLLEVDELWSVGEEWVSAKLRGWSCGWRGGGRRARDVGQGGRGC